MAAKGSPVKEKILEVLKEKGEMTKEELAKVVAEALGKQGREVKAVITKMVKSGELKEEGGKIKLA